jgi:hypothetical protein
MKILIMSLLTLLSFQTFADVGNGKVLNCGKKFSIYQTAAVESFQGQLLIGNRTIALEC